MVRRITTKAPASPATSIPIVLYTRATCHLCDEMKSELERSGLLQPGALREVDVDLDAALAQRYGTVVPVLEIGGRVAYRARIRPGTLARRLARLTERYERAGPGPGPSPYLASPEPPPSESSPSESQPSESKAPESTASRVGPPESELPGPETSEPGAAENESALSLTQPIEGIQRVMLVDDHELVRSALAGAIAQQQGFEIACVASSASEALEKIVGCEPDLVVMDIDMPGMICFDAVKRMREERSDLRVIFLSAFFHDHYIEQALRVGANGYVVKGRPLEVLFEALRQVARGRDYFSPEVRSRILVDSGGARHLETPTTLASALTDREIQVLRYLARGLSKKEIARTMELSVKTVEHHAAGVMRKLDIHDRVELTRYAIREGLAEA